MRQEKLMVGRDISNEAPPVHSIAADLGLNTVDVFGMPVILATKEQLTRCLTYALENNYRGWFGSLNAHAVNLTYEYSWLKDFFKHSLVCYSDGAGVLFAGWMNGTKIPERIALTDWIFDICALTERTHRSLYFLATHESTLEKAVKNLTQRFPSLNIVGYRTGYFDESESKAIVEDIRKVQPHILIIGRGMPLQEKWLMDHFDETGAQIALDAGALFDYLAEEKIYCPAMMGEWGLEWFFRLITEPTRYWKRYLIGNPLFLYRIIREKRKRPTPKNIR